MNGERRFLQEIRIPEWVWKVLFFVCLAFGLKSVYDVFCRTSGVGLALIILLTRVLPLGLVCGILFIKAYLPGIAERFAYGFLFPRTYLKKAPPMLSPYKAMLAAGNYAEAFEELSQLAEEYPADGDVIYLYASAGMNLENCADQAFLKMEQYFRCSSRNPQAAHAKLLFFYADNAVKFGRTEHLCGILRNEMKLSYYTDIEKKSIRTRLNSLERKTQNADF